MIEFKNIIFCMYYSLIIFFLWASPLLADELNEKLKLWEANAPYCNGFPSKVSWEDSKNHCDDGDMVLFVGLLCGAGDERGCETVRLSMDSNGRWFRSPRRRLTNNDGNGNSFSPDMALGAQIYLTKQKDYKAAALWYNWIEDHIPCSLTDTKCNLKGLPRFCTDDSEKGCTIQPNHLAILAETRHKLGIKSELDSGCPQELRSIEEIWAIYMAPWRSSKGLYYLTDIACGAAPAFNHRGAQFNDKGFPLHLIATEIFLLRLMEKNDPQLNLSAAQLVQRQPENPFFLYLRDGPTAQVLNKTLNMCPENQEEINRSRKSQWSWERADADLAYKDSMLWDCIFMAKLFANGLVN